MREVDERAGNRDVGQRQPVLNQIARRRHHTFEIVVKRGQVGLARLCRRLVAFLLEEFRRDHAVEKYRATLGTHHSVGKFLVPDCPRPRRRVGGEHRRFGVLGLEIGDDRGRIRNLEIAVGKAGHFLERTAFDKFGIGVAKAGRHHFNLQPLFGDGHQYLADERGKRGAE